MNDNNVWKTLKFFKGVGDLFFTQTQTIQIFLFIPEKHFSLKKKNTFSMMKMFKSPVCDIYILICVCVYV